MSNFNQFTYIILTTTNIRLTFNTSINNLKAGDIILAGHEVIKVKDVIDRLWNTTY